MIYQRLLTSSLTRNRPFCLLGAAGVGKTTLISEFAKQFSNCIHLDLETSDDRSIFSEGAPWDETLRAMSFLKDKELRGKGTLIVLDEIGRCPGAIEWASGHSDKWTG